jgi:hypothetical protein
MVVAFLVVFTIIDLAGTKTVDFPDRTELPFPFIFCAESSAEHALRKRNARLGDINIVLMVEHGKAPSPELIERANGIRRQWIEYWETITGHRASMTTKPR